MQGLVPTVLLGEWELECLLFDRDSIASPAPTLFMANREVSREALDSHDKRLFQDSTIVAGTSHRSPSTICITQPLVHRLFQ